MENIIKQTIKNLLSKSPIRISSFKKSNPEFIEVICKETKFLEEDCELVEKIYCYLNDITEKPKCIHCKETFVSFGNIKDGYKEFCSLKCIRESPIVKERKRQNYFNKTGYYSHFQNPEVIEKVKKTSKERYGREWHVSAKSVKEKSKETSLKRYGSEYNINSEQAKRKQIEKYGSLYTKNKEERNTYTKKMKNTLFSRALERIKKAGFEFKNLNRITELDSYEFDCSICGNHNVLLRKLFWDRINEGVLKNELKDSFICTKCNPINSGFPKAEREVAEYIKTIYKKNIKLNDRRTLGGKQELDIYLPDIKLAIEYNGNYWHSEQALNGINDNGPEKHLNKLKRCEELGIILIQIFEFEWTHYKKEVIQTLNKSITFREKELTMNLKSDTIDFIDIRTDLYCEEINYESYIKMTEKYKDLTFKSSSNDDKFICLYSSFESKESSLALISFSLGDQVVYLTNYTQLEEDFISENNYLHHFLYYLKNIDYQIVRFKLDKRFGKSFINELGNIQLTVKETLPPQSVLVNKDGLKVKEFTPDKTWKLWDCGYDIYEIYLNSLNYKKIV